MSLEQELALIEKDFQAKKAASKANFDAVVKNFRRHFPETELKFIDSIEVAGKLNFEYPATFEVTGRTFAIALGDREENPELLIKTQSERFCQIGARLTVKNSRREIAEEIYRAIKAFNF